MAKLYFIYTVYGIRRYDNNWKQKHNKTKANAGVENYFATIVYFVFENCSGEEVEDRDKRGRALKAQMGFWEPENPLT